jgi:NarL family two-component system response regulator LiaR
MINQLVRIALIDDHPLAINGIGAWLCATGRFEIAGTARTLNEGRSLMELLNPLPEVIILDVSLGTGDTAQDGLDFIPILKEVCLEKNATMPGVLVCSMYEDPFLIQRAIDSGAQAYVAKSAESGEIIKAIDAILAGNTYVEQRYRMNSAKSVWLVLSRRENEIVSLIKQSLSSRQIASRLGINIRTVENHLANIYIKTGANSRIELMEM